MQNKINMQDSSSIPEARGRIMLAAYKGDEHTVRSFLQDPHPSLRAASLSGLLQMKAATIDDGANAVCDSDDVVRLRACELAPHLPGADYIKLLDSDNYIIVEAACFAVGEVRDSHGLEKLINIALNHKEPICRESAVAALGAIGNKKALPCLIEKLDDSANIRRRAVLALSVFIETAEALEAIKSRINDKDWQVRQIVENILFR